uniref:Ig-like domain-containing protein n=1 Tax=Astyanax mexicanus TaxID=7994 RepID=A0A3B1KA67_ASTMX
MCFFALVFSVCGFIKLIIINTLFPVGVCVLAEEKTALERRAAAGSSFILPLGNQTDSVSYAQWKYKEQSFAIYRNKKIAITNVLQFSGRLKVNSDYLSVEVMNLQLSDSGRYNIITQSSSGKQLPTEMIILTVYDVVKVEIKSEQTWKAATNSCDVHLLCRASEDQTVFYRWRGFKEEDGAQLNFTLKPEEGDVTLNCSASGSNGNGSNTTTVKCTPKTTPTGNLYASYQHVL